MPAILTLRRWRQEDQNLEPSLDYIAMFCHRAKASLVLVEHTYKSSNWKAEAGGYNRKPFDKMKQAPKFLSYPSVLGEGTHSRSGDRVLCADPPGFLPHCYVSDPQTPLLL